MIAAKVHRNIHTHEFTDLCELPACAMCSLNMSALQAGVTLRFVRIATANSAAAAAAVLDAPACRPAVCSDAGVSELMLSLSSLVV